MYLNAVKNWYRSRGWLICCYLLLMLFFLCWWGRWGYALESVEDMCECNPKLWVLITVIITILHGEFPLWPCHFAVIRLVWQTRTPTNYTSTPYPPQTNYMPGCPPSLPGHGKNYTQLSTTVSCKLVSTIRNFLHFVPVKYVFCLCLLVMKFTCTDEPLFLWEKRSNWM